MHPNVIILYLLYHIFMSQIVLDFLPRTLVLSFDIDLVLTLSNMDLYFFLNKCKAVTLTYTILRWPMSWKYIMPGCNCIVYISTPFIIISYMQTDRWPNFQFIYIVTGVYLQVQEVQEAAVGGGAGGGVRTGTKTLSHPWYTGVT